MTLRLSLSLPDIDALIAALPAIRPSVANLGPSALAQIDWPHLTVQADLRTLVPLDLTPAPEPVEELVRRVVGEDAAAQSEVSIEIEDAPRLDLLAGTLSGMTKPLSHQEVDAAEIGPSSDSALPGHTTQLEVVKPALPDRAFSLAGTSELGWGPALAGKAPSSEPIEAAPPAPRALTSLGAAWSNEEDEQVLAMKAEGRTHQEIAARLGRSVKAVDVRVGKLRQKGGIATHKPGPVVDQELLAKIQRLRAEGLTCPQIGERVGMTGTAVKLRLMRAAKEAKAAKREPAEPVQEVHELPAGPAEGDVPADPVDGTHSISELVAPVPRAESAPLPALRPTRPEPAPRPVALVTEAIRAVRSADRPVMGSDGPAERAPASTKAATAMDLRRRIEAHLDILGHEGIWTTRRDLDLSERAVALGGSALIPAEVERFKALCAPIRQTTYVRRDGHTSPRTANSPEGQELLLRILRERAALVEAAE